MEHVGKVIELPNSSWNRGLRHSLVWYGWSDRISVRDRPNPDGKESSISNKFAKMKKLVLEYFTNILFEYGQSIDAIPMLRNFVGILCWEGIIISPPPRLALISLVSQEFASRISRMIISK